jgi:hypothetical protein
MAGTLTAADAVITLTVSGLFPSPVRLQGFSADNIYDSPNQALNETAMGVDGRLSAGFIYSPVDQNFTLQGDSDSLDFFETLAATMQQVKDTYFMNGNTTIPAQNKTYVMTRGVLVDFASLPTLNKIIAPRRALIRWQSIQPIPN